MIWLPMVMELSLLINILEEEFLGVTQPTYSDDSGALGMFSNVKIYFNLL